jgi:hypothetical protein
MKTTAVKSPAHCIGLLMATVSLDMTCFGQSQGREQQSRGTTQVSPGVPGSEAAQSEERNRIQPRALGIHKGKPILTDGRRGSNAKSVLGLDSISEIRATMQFAAEPRYTVMRRAEIGSASSEAGHWQGIT